MASISAALRRVKEEPMSIVDREVVERSCCEAGHRWKERCLDPARTLGVFVAQIAHGNTAIAHLVRLVGGEFSESAYCQARARLPLAAVQANLDAFTARARASLEAAGSEGNGLWCGRRVVLLDGSGVCTPDTPELRTFLGTSPNYEPGCGLPLANVLAVFDARYDLFLGMHVAPAHTGDVKHAHDLHPALAPGDVLVGDRAFGSYVHMAMLTEAGMYGVFRMNASRQMPFPAKSGERERRPGGRHRREEPILVQLIAENDQLVEIVKPHNRPGHLPPERFASIPAKMVVRAVRYRVEQPGWRSREITLLTSLLDAQTYTAADLAALYLSRWRIEVNLRHLKRTLGMSRLKRQSLDGVKRELLTFALVYNAVCVVRARAAAAQGAELKRVSFIDALRWLLLEAGGVPAALRNPPDLKLWPRRPPRVHPRLLKHTDRPFRVMRRPRKDLIADLVKAQPDVN